LFGGECREGKSRDSFKIIKFVIITYLSLPKIDLYSIPPSGGMVHRKRALYIILKAKCF
jgi:hypothetical protein